METPRTQENIPKSQESFEQQTSMLLFQHVLQQPNLLPKIMAAIEQKHKAQLRQKLATVFVGFTAAIGALALTVNQFVLQLERTGILQMFGLLFTDFQTIVAHWQEFLLSLLQSVPIAESISVLGSVFFVLFTFKYLVQEIHNLRSPLDRTHEYGH